MNYMNTPLYMKIASIPIDGASNCVLKNEAMLPVVKFSSHLKR